MMLRRKSTKYVKWLSIFLQPLVSFLNVLIVSTRLTFHLARNM